MTLAVPLIRPQPFYLGTHQPHWVKDPQFQDIPLFVSIRRLMRMKTVPPALGAHARDSGGFSEIRMHGAWTFTVEEYIRFNRWLTQVMGSPDFVAPMDWMCEPWVIQGKNRHLKPKDPRYFHGTREARGIPEDDPDEDLDSAILKHQRWTVENVVHLRERAPDLPVIPVLQGWELAHYDRCLQMYLDAGMDLRHEPLVGLGSVCRRQATEEIGEIVKHFHGLGIRLHGFGIKTQGLTNYGAGLTSADSLAWSFNARHRPPLPGHEVRHKNCANCKEFAIRWRANLIDQLATLQRAA